MPFKFVVLGSDGLLYLLLLSIIMFVCWASTKPSMRSAWGQVIQNRLALVSLIILSLYTTIALLDSIHYRPVLDTPGNNGAIHYDTKLRSVFDALVSPLGDHYEKTYSAPFSKHLFVKEAREQAAGNIVRIYPPLKYVSQTGDDVLLKHLLIGSVTIISL